MTSVCACIGLGSNLGDRLSHLRQACEGLAATAGIQVVGRSFIYETAALGLAQPDFLNAALAVETSLSAQALLLACLAIERQLGRIRAVPGGPRLIDLDVLLYGDELIAEPDLVIPHPRMHLRAFALVPLLDLVAKQIHPKLGQPLREMLRDLSPSQQIRQTKYRL